MIDYVPMPLLVWLATLPGWAVRAVLDVSFGLFAILCLFIAYYAFRRAAGHRRFKGKWYNADAYAQLIQELYTGVREGRVPDFETMELLDRHIYGKTSALRQHAKRDAI